MTDRGILVRVGAPTDTLPLAKPQSSWLTVRTALVCVAMWFLSDSANALIVGSNPAFAPDTTVNPASYGPEWTKGDPGVNNFSTSGSYVYLGDGWVLSARHVGYFPANGVQFQTPTGPVTYSMAGARVAADGVTLIPGPYYTDYGFSHPNGHQFAVSNPASIQLENGQMKTLSSHTDLMLFRINGDPGLPALTIATQSLPNNFTAGTAPELMTVSNGHGRAAAETHWNLTGSSPDITWTVTSGTGDKQGYLNNGIAAKRWGTNRVSDPVEASTIFSGIVSNTTGTAELNFAVGAIVRDAIVNITAFDKSTEFGATLFESQAIPGDSGGAVFYKRNNSQWELSGIVNAVYIFEDQPWVSAVYDNVTMISDLSYYNQDYFHSIKHIMETHRDYSSMGDVNLDGMVSGDGTGPMETDDITSFVQGWKFSNGTSQGDITSWKKGDLNRDGRTDVADFILLRTAFNGQPMGAAVLSLVGSAVPEPSTAVLAFLGLAAFVGRRRRRPLR